MLFQKDALCASCHPRKRLPLFPCVVYEFTLQHYVHTSILFARGNNTTGCEAISSSVATCHAVAMPRCCIRYGLQSRACAAGHGAHRPIANPPTSRHVRPVESAI